jgi:hypothetical protein
METVLIDGESREFDAVLEESVKAQLGFTFNETGFIVTTGGLLQENTNAALSEEESESTLISYTPKDNDSDNLFSVDIINSFDGNGPIFMTQGGRSSCPWEDKETSNFFSEENFSYYLSHRFSYLDSLQAERSDPRFKTSLELRFNRKIKELDNKFIEDAVASPDAVGDRAAFSTATQQVEVPLLSVTVAERSNIPEEKSAEFELILENNSASESDGDFLLIVDNTSNPNNALINIEPNGKIVYVPYGERVIYKMTLRKSISDVYDYEDIRVMLRSLCDGDESSDRVIISDTVFVTAHFVPSCSDVVVNAPLSNWVYNMDADAQPINISLNGFNTSFANFHKIDLQYRLASAPNWTGLHAYYGSQQSYDDALQDGESASQISVINDPTISYALDIADMQMQDGEYEIRARSSCYNGTELISDVVTGRVDLNAPQRFGTPLPVDGILGHGEDIKVRFDESVFHNSAVSTIEIKGETNQLPIDHNVSLRFEGQQDTVVIERPGFGAGDFTLEFWMNNSSTSTADTAYIVNQVGGLAIGLSSGKLLITLFGIDTITAKSTKPIANDGLFHHYTFTYNTNTGDLRIYEDNAEIAGQIGAPDITIANNNALVIGGSTFIGNMHDLRIWSKSIDLATAYAHMHDKLIGNEAGLLGYWPMDEGRGSVASDLARFKHAQVDAGWDIKPKGNSYDFSSDQYLTMDSVALVQLTREMDATISFWMKTGTSQTSTLFSNGKGDGTDSVQSNGLRNKWAINMASSGTLSLESEDSSYVLTSNTVADGSWHHIALLFNRIGSLRTYVDAELVSSHPMDSIGGFSGSKIWLGARGAIVADGTIDTVTVDQEFTGKIDEVRLWNTLRNAEQISRDRFNEIVPESVGLLLYARMNAPDSPKDSGPSYYHAYGNRTIMSTNAVLSSGTVNYSDDVPPIKPKRTLINFQVNRVINGDEMILEPVVTDWASLEGQVLDITVEGMYDDANNRQQSPITWTAYVRRNEVSWFAEGYNEIVDIVKQGSAEHTFDITIVNKGGNLQSFAIADVPAWLKLSSTSGTISPSGKIQITAAIDQELNPGEYLQNLYLQTDFGYDEKMQVKVRVIEQEPDWTVIPDDFRYSMNVIGKVSIDGILSEDLYDKVGAFDSTQQVRGSANLVYNEAYQDYFVYLTIFSDGLSEDKIKFSIWDASQGRVLCATLNGDMNVSFQQNAVIGTLSEPASFENTTFEEQSIELNEGWTWVSFNVNDPNFVDLNQLTSNLSLINRDMILNTSSATFAICSAGTGSWSSSDASNLALASDTMYMINLHNHQTLGNL